MKKGKIVPIVITSILTVAWLVCWGMFLFYPREQEETDRREDIVCDATTEQESEKVSENAEKETESEAVSENAEKETVPEAAGTPVWTSGQCEEIVERLRTERSDSEQKETLLRMAKAVVMEDICSLDGNGVVVSEMAEAVKKQLGNAVEQAALYEQYNEDESVSENRLSSGQVKTDGEYYLLSGPFFEDSDEYNSLWLTGYADVLFVKDDESRVGFSVIYARTYSEKKKIASVEASSVLPPEYGKTYDGANLVDGSYETAWVEGVDGVGIGESVTLRLQGETEVYGVLIYNGYLASASLYQKNGKVNRVKIDFGNGVTKTAEIPVYTVTSSDDRILPSDYSIGRVELDEAVVTDTIKITILDAEAGTKYEDTCISEIQIY